MRAIRVGHDGEDSIPADRMLYFSAPKAANFDAHGRIAQNVIPSRYFCSIRSTRVRSKSYTCSARDRRRATYQQACRNTPRASAALHPAAIAGGLKDIRG